MKRKRTREAANESHSGLLAKMEEIMVRKAIRESVEFMAGFGKGSRPPLIDLRHYENASPPVSDGDDG